MPLNVPRNHAHNLFYFLNLHISRRNVALTVNSELYNATLLIAKFENKVGRLQLASIAGCKTKCVEVFSVMFA